MGRIKSGKYAIEVYGRKRNMADQYLLVKIRRASGIEFVKSKQFVMH